MQPLRIDLVDMKAQLAKKIGVERSKRYFYYLNRMLSQKLRKVEFDRLCFRVLGRENLPLHNQFILSILKNACHTKSPQAVHDVGPAKSVIPTVEYGQEQSASVVPNQTPSAPIWSNGVVLPTSPRKGRSTIRDRKLRDRPSSLGLNGKADSVSHHSTIEDSGLTTLTENGNLAPYDYQRPMRHTQGIAEHPDNEMLRIEKSTDTPVSLHSEKQIKIGFVEDGEKVEQDNCLNISRSPLLAPLGIPLCSASVGGAHKALSVSSSSDFNGYFYSGGLSDTEMLRKRMEKIAAAQGLGVVSMECASMLNKVLDVYLKRLIRSCVELVGARSEHEPSKHPAHKQQIQGKLINGMWPSNHLQMQSSSGPPDIMQEQRPHCSISLLDFTVAMKLNPQKLGEDWPLLLEKICMHSFEEFT